MILGGMVIFLEANMYKHPFYPISNKHKSDPCDKCGGLMRYNSDGRCVTCMKDGDRARREVIDPELVKKRREVEALKEMKRLDGELYGY